MCTRLAAIWWGVCRAGKCCHLSRQPTDDLKLFLYMCLRSPEPPHPTSHTLTPLQPTAHLASVRNTFNVSLYILSTQHSLRFRRLVRPRTGLHEPAANCSARHVCLPGCYSTALACEIQSKTFVLGGAHTTCISVTQIAIGFFSSPSSSVLHHSFWKSNFVCLQLSVTRVGKERLNQGGDWSTCS